MYTIVVEYTPLVRNHAVIIATVSLVLHVSPIVNLFSQCLMSIFVFQAT